MRVIRFIDKKPGDDGDNKSSKEAGFSDKKSYSPWRNKPNKVERAPRYNVTFDTSLYRRKLFSSALLGQAETVDISVTGAKLMFADAIGFGTKLDIKINDFSSKKYMSLIGSVVRCRRNILTGAKYAVYEIGVAFKNMNTRKAKKLEQWVQNSERFGTDSFVH